MVEVAKNRIRDNASEPLIGRAQGMSFSSGAFMRSRLMEYCSGSPMEHHSGLDNIDCKSI
jgi:hypothetical protein